jgi:hypothetical protein
MDIYSNIVIICRMCGALPFGDLKDDIRGIGTVKVPYKREYHRLLHLSVVYFRTWRDSNVNMQYMRAVLTYNCI